jgi:hypothetical protein
MLVTSRVLDITRNVLELKLKPNVESLLNQMVLTSVGTWAEVQPTLVYRTEKYIAKSTLCLNRIATITPAEGEVVDKVGKLV